jgi:beta-galactosidase
VSQVDDRCLTGIRVTVNKRLLVFAILAAVCTVLSLAALSATADERQVISLNGLWEIADSVAPDKSPNRYEHRGPVPGLAHSATPAFENVDLFDSNARLRYYASDHPELADEFKFHVPKRELPTYSRITPAGIAYQRRNYFWYRTTFLAPSRRDVAILKVGKAQYGSQIWVNGHNVGGHMGCATSAFYDISQTIRWSRRNDVVIRIGAHPGILPDGDGCGVDFENAKWTAGIWDSVTVLMSGNPHIETIQVAPDVKRSRILVQTELRNYGPKAERFVLLNAIHPYRSTKLVARSGESVSLLAGEQKTVTVTIDLPHAKLWTPEDPNLYVVEASSGADTASTRFGMREFRFDTATRRAYLNGKPYFMRGGGIALNRFFEDPASGQLPWKEEWVRKLLVSIPKKMHWNSFRSFAGALPDAWLDIADEAGMLIDYEYPIAYDLDKTLTKDLLIAEYSAWMRDSRNHASVAIWDACDECASPLLHDVVIPAVRPLDLSERPWEASWSGPVGPDDPVADHPYKFIANVLTETGRGEFHVKSDFDPADLEFSYGGERLGNPLTGHAMFINEYGWLWLNRDGSPTLLTQQLYPKLPYPVDTPEHRLETQAYLLAGLTEYWRAYRIYAGVLHYAYLLSSHPWAATSDSFRNIEQLELNPYFESYVSEAFKPLGVYLNLWQRELHANENRSIQVMMINDEETPRNGMLKLILEEAGGDNLSQQVIPFAISSYGQETYTFELEVPGRTGNFWLKAIAMVPADTGAEPTVSRRHVAILP